MTGSTKSEGVTVDISGLIFNVGGRLKIPVGTGGLASIGLDLQYQTLQAEASGFDADISSMGVRFGGGFSVFF